MNKTNLMYKRVHKNNDKIVGLWHIHVPINLLRRPAEMFDLVKGKCHKIYQLGISVKEKWRLLMLIENDKITLN